MYKTLHRQVLLACPLDFSIQHGYTNQTTETLRPFRPFVLQIAIA